MDPGGSVEPAPAQAGVPRERLWVCQGSGLSWPLPEGMDERAIETLFPGAGVSTPARRAMPDWARVHTELRRKGVTLSLLWQEYKAEHPDGVQYSQFCERYHALRQGVDVVMRQSHRTGEKLFVDYAGRTAPVVDRESGVLRQAQVFVAVLGASSYTYAEATWTQTQPGWCASRAHVAVSRRRPRVCGARQPADASLAFDAQGDGATGPRTGRSGR